MIFGNARAEEPAERVCFVGRSNGGGSRGDWPCGLQRGESREFVGGGGHLGTQPVEDGEGGFFCARGEIAGRADAGGTALFAGTGGNEVWGFLHEQSGRSKERFGRADFVRGGVEEIRIGVEEFIRVGVKVVVQ